MEGVNLVSGWSWRGRGARGISVLCGAGRERGWTGKPEGGTRAGKEEEGAKVGKGVKQ